MWQTSEGERCLRRAEGRLLQAGVVSLLGALDRNPQTKFDIEVFDLPTPGLKLVALEQAVSGLVLADVLQPMLFRANEAAISAVYVRLRRDALAEIGSFVRPTQTSIMNALEELEGGGLEPQQVDWSESLEMLVGRIFEDEFDDFTLVDAEDSAGFDEARRRFQLFLNFHFAAVTPDPTARELSIIRKKLSRLITRKLPMV